MFDTKIALVVRDDLAQWQKLNVTAFLASGVAAEAPESIGEPYADALGRAHGRMFAQPVLVFAADGDGLRKALRRAHDGGLTPVAYVAAMFATGHDEANREVFRAEDPEAPDLVGIGLRGERKAVDKAIKGLKFSA
jgi:hypothetical protein